MTGNWYRTVRAGWYFVGELSRYKRISLTTDNSLRSSVKLTPIQIKIGRREVSRVLALLAGSIIYNPLTFCQFRQVLRLAEPKGNP